MFKSRRLDFTLSPFGGRVILCFGIKHFGLDSARRSRFENGISDRNAAGDWFDGMRGGVRGTQSNVAARAPQDGAAVYGIKDKARTRGTARKEYGADEGRAHGGL